MEERTLTCIGCPMGCQVSVQMDAGKILSVTGNTCPRGDAYAREEVTAPARTVTSTIPVAGGGRKVRIPCKTASDVPKQKIFEVMSQIHKASAKAPVRRGDVLIRNVAGTGVDVIATGDVL